MMKRFLVSALVIWSVATPVLADDFTDSLQLALEAYEDGDVATAQDELAYATQLLLEMQGADFTQYLPEALDGWTREIGDDQSGALAMFGGGVLAKADYSNGQDSVEVQLMADNALATSMVGMLGSAVTMAMMGKVVRINRKTFLQQDDDIQGVLGKVFISVTGSASLVDKIAYAEAMDFDALEDY
jgi:hypothetical protein